VVLCWVKRIWCCPHPACQVKTWTERHPAIAPRAAVTERARAEAAAQVGCGGCSVARQARCLGVGWQAVMGPVHALAQPLIDDPARLPGVSRIGVDEHVWHHARPGRRTGYATSITDLSPGRPPRLLDLVEGRSGAVLADWLAQRGPDWRAGVEVATLDAFRGYASALAAGLPGATRVLDAFHVVRLGLSTVDGVRQRVQQDTLTHRGRAADPLYRARRLARIRADRLDQHARARLAAHLNTGDPNGELTAAWVIAQDLMRVYQHTDSTRGRRAALQVIARALDCPVPEAQRLGRTLHAWQAEFLAYFTTGRATNGPTEAINLGIETTRRIGYGFRNFTNYRTRQLLAHGDLTHDHATQRIRRRRPRFVA
jgi:transposase